MIKMKLMKKKNALLRNILNITLIGLVLGFFVLLFLVYKKSEYDNQQLDLLLKEQEKIQKTPKEDLLRSNVQNLLDGLNIKEESNFKSEQIFKHPKEDFAISVSNVVSYKLKNEDFSLLTAHINNDVSIKQYPSPTELYNDSSLSYYQFKDTVCLSNSKDSEFSCIHLITLNSLLTKYSDIHQAYTKKNGSLPQTTNLYKDLEITDSPKKPYKRASMLIGTVKNGAKIKTLFYKDNSWHYFRNEQGTLRCYDFPKGVIRDAFSGFTCLGINLTNDKLE